MSLHVSAASFLGVCTESDTSLGFPPSLLWAPTGVHGDCHVCPPQGLPRVPPTYTWLSPVHHLFWTNSSYQLLIMSMPGDRVLLISSLPKGACLPLDCGLAGFSIAQFSNRLKKKKKKSTSHKFQVHLAVFYCKGWRNSALSSFLCPGEETRSSFNYSSILFDLLINLVYENILMASEKNSD